MDIIKSIGVGSLAIAVIVAVFFNILPVQALFIIPVIIIAPSLVELCLDYILGKIHYFILLDNESKDVSKVVAKRTNKSTVTIDNNDYAVDLSKKFHIFMNGMAQELKLDTSNSKLIPSKELSVIIRSNVLEKLFTSNIDKYIFYIMAGVGVNLMFTLITFWIMNSNFQKILVMMGG